MWPNPIIFADGDDSWVQTDMGNAGARANGMDEAPLTLDASVKGMLDRVCCSFPS